MLSRRPAPRIPSRSRIPRRLLVVVTPVAVVAALLPAPAQAAGAGVEGSAPGTDTAPTASAAPAAPAPKTQVKRTKVPTVKPDGGGATKVVAELPQTSTEGYRMIGVTWAKDSTAEGVTVEVRTRTAGAWSGWTDLEVEDDETGEAEAGNPGTEPLWVGEADGVAARLTSDDGTPKDVEISTIDPGTDDEEASVTTSPSAFAGPADGVARATTAASTTDGTPSFPSRPTIISRSAWGATSGSYCSSPQVGSTTRGAIMHHTAGSNDYTAAQSRALIRGVQAYHTRSRGWCDIGYNFLVDKYGQIFEGRKGGTDRNVRAAHSGNDAVNTFTMGVSMMGNLDKVKPSTLMKNSVVRLVGWRVGTTYLKSRGKYSLGGKSLNMIGGHRDVVGTGCPGTYGYVWLSQSGGLRDRVEDYLSKMVSPIKTRAASLGSSATGAVFIGEAGLAGGRRTLFAAMDVYDKSGASARYVASAGGFRSRLASAGGPAVLGYPTSDSPRTGSSVTAQRFEKGSIYAVPSKGTFSVRGSADTLYRQLSGSAGKLGAPTSSSSSTRTSFAGGYITVASGTATAYSTSGAKLGSTNGTTTPTAPAAPVGTVGTVRATSTSSSATFSWPKVTGATSYDVCLMFDYSSSTCARTSRPTTTTVTYTGLKPTADTDYVAKVRAVKGSTVGAWSKAKGVNLTTTAAPSSTSVTVPGSGVVSISGHGYGHGIGMSQYGAEGAARQGLTYSRILAHYYPGTTLSTKTGNIRVLISAATSSATTVAGQSGLKLNDMSGKKTYSLPTSVSGRSVDRWQMVPYSSGSSSSKLQYRTTGGYVTHRDDGKIVSWKGDGQFYASSPVSLILPNGSAIKLRGLVRSAKPSSGSGSRDTVNSLSIDDYVRGVIAAEMPAGWKPEALKSQAVAARTYGVRAITSSRYYDICSTTACQVYGGASRETSTTNAAVKGTAGKILTYGGSPAFTQFSSSSGGYSAVGSQPYLRAQADPYDGWSGNANHSWKTTVKASTIQKAHPSIGTLKKMTITKRSGQGAYGGRVESITLTGSSKSVTITGNDARWDLGLKSNWFTF